MALLVVKTFNIIFPLAYYIKTSILLNIRWLIIFLLPLKIASLSLLSEVLSTVNITAQNDPNLNKLIKKVSGIILVKGILKIAYLYQLST